MWLVQLCLQHYLGGGCDSNHCCVMELLLDRTNYLNWFFDWLFVCQNCKRWAAAFLQFFVMRKRNCHVNTGPLRFADGKYRRATVVTPALRKKWSAAARVNWKTNLGSREEYLVAISGVGDLLLCLRNGWNRYLRFPILQVQQCFWSIQEHGSFTDDLIQERYQP